jgi:hypothetical protein
LILAVISTRKDNRSLAVEKLMLMFIDIVLDFNKK